MIPLLSLERTRTPLFSFFYQVNAIADKRDPVFDDYHEH